MSQANAPFQSISVADHPDWCVVLDKKDCSGVRSWHHDEHEAKTNAKFYGGTALPVDYINGDLIIPSLAEKIIRKNFPCLED